MTGYRICTRCVMDTSDPLIRFDSDGVCNHCAAFDRKRAEIRAQRARMNTTGYCSMVDLIKRQARKSEYDCVLGLSGGVDSSYLAYYAVTVLGLRPLAVHVDGGWNSELAVKNIQNIVQKLKIDLFTYVVDWREMRDIQLAFIRAGVPNVDIPQDHAFFAALYSTTSKHGISTIISGSNFATESVLASHWSHSWVDLRHIKAIHRKYGARKLDRFPTISLYQYYVHYPLIRTIRVHRPLNWIDYRKSEAVETLEREVGFRYYDVKHGESRFTRFFQSYYLPQKFGYDKRRAHLSSLVLGEEITRADALKELKTPPYDQSLLAEDMLFIAKKLGITMEEFRHILDAPPKSHSDYQSSASFFRLKRQIRSVFGR